VVTLFVYSLPYEYVIRIWDFLICKNIFAIISIGLAILKRYEKLLLEQELSDMMEFFKNLKEKEEILMSNNI
jgi:hypothetical protein